MINEYELQEELQYQRMLKIDYIMSLKDPEYYDKWELTEMEEELAYTEMQIKFLEWVLMLDIKSEYPYNTNEICILKDL